MKLRSGRRTVTPRGVRPYTKRVTKQTNEHFCPARTISSEMTQSAFFALIEALQAEHPTRSVHLHNDLVCRIQVKGKEYTGQHAWISPNKPRTTSNIGVRYLNRNARPLDSEGNRVRILAGTVCLI